jgi:hypothetical protein
MDAKSLYIVTLNVSSLLRRMLKASGLPRVGPAHVLRMRYAQVTHVLCPMQRHCTHGRIVLAMRELLEGWTDTEEEDTRVGGYHESRRASAVGGGSCSTASSRLETAFLQPHPHDSSMYSK